MLLTLYGIPMEETLIMKSSNKLRSSSYDKKRIDALPKLKALLRKTTIKPQVFLKRKQSPFILSDPDKLHRLKSQLACSRNRCRDLSQEREFLSGWKSLFSNRLKRAADIRKSDNCGCRPGETCLKKRTDSQTKDFYLVDREPMLDLNCLGSTVQDSADFLQRKEKIMTTLELILQCYDYLRSLHYSERKICQIIKFHCCENIDIRSILLRRTGLESPSKSSMQYHYETDLAVLLRKVSAVMSRKHGFGVEQFIFSLEEFQRRLQKDIEQRSTELMNTTSMEISNRLEILRKADSHHQHKPVWSDRRFVQNDKRQPLTCFAERLASVERQTGEFQKISGLTRNIYKAMQERQTGCQRIRVLSQPDEY